MSILDDKRDELERFEFMMGAERGRLAVALDLLTDALILTGQHGVYCVSNRNPAAPRLDLQAVLEGINGAKSLIQSVMTSLATGPGNAGPGNAGPGKAPAKTESRESASPDPRD